LKKREERSPSYEQMGRIFCEKQKVTQIFSMTLTHKLSASCKPVHFSLPFSCVRTVYLNTHTCSQGPLTPENLLPRGLTINSCSMWRQMHTRAHTHTFPFIINGQMDMRKKV